MTPAQCTIFRDWWGDVLIMGAAWFSAAWPIPRGMVTAVRKFKGAPRFTYVPGGFWRISAVCEIRGVGELPFTHVQPAATLLWHFDTDYVQATGDVLDSPMTTYGGQPPFVIGTPAKFGVGASQHNAGYRVTTGGASLHNTFPASQADGTVDFWILLGEGGGFGPFVALWAITKGSTSGIASLYLRRSNSSGLLELVISNLAGVETIILTSSFPLPLGAYTHIAVTREAGVTRLFIGGVLAATSVVVFDSEPAGTSVYVMVGNYWTDSSHATGMIGSIDELRHVNGAAAWVSSFTPPVAAYSPS
jgi:hypothetical protein